MTSKNIERAFFYSFIVLGFLAAIAVAFGNAAVGIVAFCSGGLCLFLSGLYHV